MLTGAQRSVLLEIARAAIVAQVTGAPPVEPLPSDLPEAAGTFVTVKHRGQLRGCLGTLECRLGLAGEVARCAADAATEDPRFVPLEPEELPEIAIDVSVLGPLQRIDAADPDAFSIGTHGLVVERGPHRGLLLPQVALEWSWTREQFLRQTCIKAGLPPDAWQQDAVVYRFDAEYFGETVTGPVD